MDYMVDRSRLLLNWIEEKKDAVELLVYDAPVKSVIEAVQVSKIEKKYFIKTIIMKNKNDAELVALIVPAGTKVDKRSIRENTGPKRWIFASPEDIQAKVGFPAGGVPPVCLPEELKVYVDPRVLKNEFVVAGGGSTTTLLRLPPYLITQEGAIEKIISYG
jgi:prolyl-tRNA editing enzyme YbaK/EbsC (Cys-tRNA(Pro) deacylase)